MTNFFEHVTFRPGRVLRGLELPQFGWCSGAESVFGVTSGLPALCENVSGCGVGCFFEVPG